jgi:hypothetical protein
MNEEQTQSNEDIQPPRQVLVLKEAIIPELRELGIQKLTIHYSGSGDEGSLQEIESEPERISLHGTIEDRVRDLVEEYLFEQYGSWGDGDGAAGTVVIETDEGKIINEHGYYRTEIDYSTVEF